MKHKAFIQRNSATVLAIAGAVGVVATVITTARAAPKAIRLLNEAKERENHELTIWQKMQVKYLLCKTSFCISLIKFQFIFR